MMNSQQAQDYALTLVRQSGTSFYWAMRVLAPEKRYAMYAIYAFCREVDDIVDGMGPIARKRQQLDDWRQEISSVYDGKPQKPLGISLLKPIERFALKQDDFLSVIDGMESDAYDCVRLSDMEALSLYMDRVACSVGRLSTRIFGIPDPLATELSKSLGEALQLTNILRDITEDASRNRLYLPADILQEHGIVWQEGDDLMQILSDPNMDQVYQSLCRMADLHFREAQSLLERCKRSHARPAMIMMALYHRLFLKLVKNKWHFPHQRVSLNWSDKMIVLLRYGLV